MACQCRKTYSNCLTNFPKIGRSCMIRSISSSRSNLVMSNSRSETGRHDLNEQEEVLFRSFITPERREQFLRRVGNPKTRARMLGQLYHFHDLDPRFAHRIAPRDQTVEKIHD